MVQGGRFRTGSVVDPHPETDHNNDSVSPHRAGPKERRKTPFSKGAGENCLWRKPVGVEPTYDTRYRTTGLKPAPSTGQDWLPGAIVTDGVRILLLWSRDAPACSNSAGDREFSRGWMLHWVVVFFPVPRSSNGRTAAFGAVNRGSNPCRGASLYYHQFTTLGVRVVYECCRNIILRFVRLTQSLDSERARAWNRIGF